jgi:hypothetical protein
MILNKLEAGVHPGEFPRRAKLGAEGESHRGAPPLKYSTTPRTGVRPFRATSKQKFERFNLAPWPTSSSLLITLLQLLITLLIPLVHFFGGGFIVRAGNIPENSGRTLGGIHGLNTRFFEAQGFLSVNRSEAIEKQLTDIGERDGIAARDTLQGDLPD